jgi:hypothetical protein
MSKATNNGTCQVCGRVQAAIGDATMAKHGYTVQWGFFSGTCAGSDRAPIEHSHNYTDRTIGELTKRAAQIDAMTIYDIKSVDIVAGSWKNKETVTFTCQADVAHHIATHKYGQREIGKTFDKYRETELWRFQNQAKKMRAHVEFLKELIETRHGQDLYPRGDGMERCKFEGIEKYRDANAKAEELKAEGWKTRVNGRGPFNVTANRSIR